LANTEKTWPAESLVVAGTQFLPARYRTRWGEIDVVARDDVTLVFVEVKTRRRAGFGGPAAAVNITKQRRLINMARSFLLGLSRCRFDVVGVVLTPGRLPVLEVIENAFGIR
jgi:putative endonuclease